jgi:hypothetical protein
MNMKIIACAIAGAFLMTPLAFGEGLLPLNPLVNGDLDTYVTPGMAAALQPVADRCFGIGHQAFDVLYSSWADSTLAHENDVERDVDAGTEAAASGDAPGAATHAGNAATTAAETDPAPTAEFLGSYPGLIGSNPAYPYYCDPNYREIAMPNAWAMSRDRGLAWSSNEVIFTDSTGDGDQEAVFNKTTTAYLYQAAVSTQQAWSADFDDFEFTLESGQLPPGAYIQIGFSVNPGYQQNPWIGIWWDGGIQFDQNDMVPDAQGRIHLNTTADGSIVCPDYTPCYDFQRAYNAGTPAEKHTLLGQVRLVQTSFWSFGNPNGNVVLDDIAYVGAKTMAETMAETPPSPNPGT